MKKIYMFICLFILLSTSSCIEIDWPYVGDYTIDFTDSNGNKVNAQIINSRTMVPLRKIFEVLGCEINWDNY